MNKNSNIINKIKDNKKIILPNIKVTKNFIRDTIELEKQYVRLVDEIKNLDKSKTIDEILAEVCLTKTKYYTIKKQIKRELEANFVKISV